MATVHREVVLSRDDFTKLLEENTGIMIFKFSASWCNPCKFISPTVETNIKELKEHVTFYDVDVDESFDLYAYLKTKKMLNGIPAILAYYKGNTSYASDSCVIGANLDEINTFFTTINTVSIE